MSTSVTTQPLVVLIAYEFSTRITGGSVRAIRFAQHLPEFGWRVHVLTATPESEHPEVPRGVRITAIASVERRFGGGIAVAPDGDGALGRNPPWLRALGFLKKLAPLERQLTWARPFWMRSVELLRDDPPVAVLSSCAPYVIMALGDALALKFRVPHTIDLRDDWRDRFLIEARSWLNRTILDRYASHFVRRAAGVTSVSPVTVARFESDYDVPVCLVMNGFVEADFTGVPYEATPSSSSGPLEMLHLGWLGDFRTIEPVLRAMETVHSSLPIRLKQYGLIEPGQRALIEASGVCDQIEIGPQVRHREAIRLMCGADVLLAIPGNRIPAALTGKLFEYLRARKPILLITGDGAARTLGKRVGIRWCVAPDDAAGLVLALREMSALKASGRLITSTDAEVVASLERRSEVRKLAAFLNSGCQAGPLERIDACDTRQLSRITL